MLLAGTDTAAVPGISAAGATPAARQRTAAADAELQVECWRGGMPSKGRVLVRNGAVRDVAVQTVTQMFP